MSNSYEKSSIIIDTKFGEFELHCFTFDDHEEDNFLCLKKGDLEEKTTIRIQSACYTAEIFRSKDCDCHEQLVESINTIAENGGLLIYMLCDGRGAGLQTKIKGLKLGQEKGLDTAEAYDELGVDRDPRNYHRVVQIIKYFDINSVKLLTNNPRKIKGLKSRGIEVERKPLEIEATESSASYLKTKSEKLGHMLEQF